MVRVCGRPRDVLLSQAQERWRRALLLAVLIPLCSLVPLAYASPPDPVWIGGLYDAADSDDQILTATSLESRVEENLPGVRPLRMIADARFASGPVIRSSHLRRAQPRAPPKS